MAGTRLRVATWNIRAGIGPGPFPDRWWNRIDADRLRAIGAFISTLDADLVALQEVAVVSRAGHLVDNAGDLARQLKMSLRYGAVRSFAVEEGSEVVGAGTFGNALLSRRPLDATRVVALPAAPEAAFIEWPGSDHPTAGVRYSEAPPTIREPRCLLVGELDGLTVGTAHFSHVGSTERLLQAMATADAFADAEGAVLAGDLNAPIDAPELAPLRSWTDGFALPADDPARVTTDDGWRIDHILARDVAVHGCRAVPGAAGLSDHLPVVAEIG